MSIELQKINSFIDQHHVLTLATSDGKDLSACSLFYAYEPGSQTFVVASSDDTLHIQHILKNNKIAGNILLETDEVGKIQGLQFRGVFIKNEDKKLSKLYFKKFPYALVLHPTLWKIEVNYFKLTDNRLGFGKKIIWP
ncbi:MAG: pyridoxamine 5'-phosphate oxidase family protein [Sulfurimonas sp.]